MRTKVLGKKKTNYEKEKNAVILNLFDWPEMPFFCQTWEHEVDRTKNKRERKKDIKMKEKKKDERERIWERKKRRKNRKEKERWKAEKEATMKENERGK